jgi:hypothetical protein
MGFKKLKIKKLLELIYNCFLRIEKIKKKLKNKGK